MLYAPHGDDVMRAGYKKLLRKGGSGWRRGGDCVRNPIAPPLKLFRQKEKQDHTKFAFTLPQRLKNLYRYPPYFAALWQNGLDFGVRGDRREFDVAAWELGSEVWPRLCAAGSGTAGYSGDGGHG